MEDICYGLNLAALAFYGLTWVAYAILFVSEGNLFGRISRALIAVSLLIHLVYLSLRASSEGHIPLATRSEAMSFFAFAVAIVYLYLDLRMRTGAMGIFVLAVVVAFQCAASLRYSPFSPIAPVLDSGWFAFHAGSAVLSFAAFTVAALLSVMYLLLVREIDSRRPGYIFRRIPPLEILDEMSYKSVMLGFLLLTLGIGTGAVWADQAWGRFWSWDPKQVSSLVVWLVYAAYLHARLQRGWEGKRVAIFSTLGFATLIFTFVFVDLLFNTIHRFI